jgi:hypothetical protein
MGIGAADWYCWMRLSGDRINWTPSDIKNWTPS